MSKTFFLIERNVNYEKDIDHHRHIYRRACMRRRICRFTIPHSHRPQSTCSVATTARQPSPETSLAQQQGKYVVLNFWKSTDAPSRQAANEYTAWQRSHPDSKLEVISVNLDESPALFNEIMRRDSLIQSDQYYLGGDTAQAVINSYGLNRGLGSMLIDPSGKIIVHNPTSAQLSQYAR